MDDDVGIPTYVSVGNIETKPPSSVEILSNPRRTRHCQNDSKPPEENCAEATKVSEHKPKRKLFNSLEKPIHITIHKYVPTTKQVPKSLSTIQRSSERYSTESGCNCGQSYRSCNRRRRSCDPPTSVKCLSSTNIRYNCAWARIQAWNV